MELNDERTTAVDVTACVKHDMNDNLKQSLFEAACKPDQYNVASQVAHSMWHSSPITYSKTIAARFMKHTEQDSTTMHCYNIVHVRCEIIMYSIYYMAQLHLADPISCMRSYNVLVTGKQEPRTGPTLQREYIMQTAEFACI